MYEQATLKHMLALVPDGGFERPVPGTEWTVRQVFAHLATSLTLYATTIRTWHEGGDPVTGWDTDGTNAETARVHAATPASDILALFGSGLNHLVEVLAAVPEDPPLFGPWDFAEALANLSGHYLSHAVPLVEALPETRMVALVLNWLLDADFDDDERAPAGSLLTEERAYIATLTFETGRIQ